MESNIPTCDTIFANDNRWDSQAAIMLGRFIALHRFRDKYKDSLRALAISPDFFYLAACQKPIVK